MSDEPKIRPEEEQQEKKSAGHLGLISVLLLLLITLVVYYFYLKRHDPGFRPWNIAQWVPSGDPAKLGRRVTFVSISPLTGTYSKDGNNSPDGICSTVYTKIGSKAVPAGGQLDIRLYEYDKSSPGHMGRQVCSWTDVRLPDSAEWGRWPLGGWNVALSWPKRPPATSVCLEAIYTNPVGKIFRAQQGPIQIAG